MVCSGDFIQTQENQLGSGVTQVNENYLINRGRLLLYLIYGVWGIVGIFVIAMFVYIIYK